jgi:hypothetical protein
MHLMYKSFAKQYALDYSLHAYTLLGSSTHNDETGVTWRIHRLDLTVDYRECGVSRTRSVHTLLQRRRRRLDG